MNVKIPQFQIPGWLAPHLGEVRTWPAVKSDPARCRVRACERAVHSLRLCLRHYSVFWAVARRAGIPLAQWLPVHAVEVTSAPAIVAPESVCWVAACTRTAHRNGLCKAHHRLARYRFGEQRVVGPASDTEAAL